MEYKEPNRTICGICSSDMGKSDKSEGDLSYDGCEEPESEPYSY